MAVRQRSGDAEGVGGGDEGLALERAFDEVDDVIGQVGEVAEGLVSDGLSLADGPSEQMGEVGLPGSCSRNGMRGLGRLGCPSVTSVASSSEGAGSDPT
jgi:hypothetical protein